METWKKVFSSAVSYEAEIAKDVLENNGINAVIVNKQDSSLNNFGFFEVHVAPQFLIKALKIVSNDLNLK